MKKIFHILVILIVLAFVQSVSAQDYQATIQYLQSQIELMSLQATVSALQNQNNTPNQGSGVALTNDMTTWGQQNSPYSATPTPFSLDPTYGTAVTMQSFPANARPLIPASAPPVWNMPKSNYYTEVTVGKSGQYTTIAEAVKVRGKYRTDAEIATPVNRSPGSPSRSTRGSPPCASPRTMNMRFGPYCPPAVRSGSSATVSRSSLIRTSNSGR